MKEVILIKEVKPRIYICKNGRKLISPEALYKCHCGKEFIANIYNVNRKVTSSCGCNKNKHGYSRSPTHTCWKAMMVRCRHKENPKYKNYASKGITVCDRWKDKKNGFIQFLEDMGERPSIEHTIDRIDNDKGYSPDNCRWATPKEQCRNKGNNVILEYGEYKMTVIEWSEIISISAPTLYSRVNRGWSDSKILETGVRSKEKIDIYKVIESSKLL